MFAQVSEVPSQVPESIGQFSQLVGPYLPTLVGAIVILVVGWLGALLVSAIVRAAMHKTGFDRRLAKWFSGEDAQAPKVERGVARLTYYLILVFVLVAFFDTLGLTQATKSLNSLLDQILVYAPRVVGAGLLLLVAWVVATVMRFFVRKVTSATKLDERLSQATSEGEEKPPATFSKTAAEAVYWLVFLLFLPAILNALALPGLLEPVQAMVGKVLSFLPNLFAAALILSIGWLAARVVQRICTSLLAAVGTDALSRRVGLTPILGEKRLSSVLGMIIYILILLPILVASLGALQLQAVTAPASEMLNMVLTALPAIFAAALVVFVAYVVGRVVAGLVTNLLTGVGFDRLPSELGLKMEHVEGRRTPSEMTGYLVLVATILFAIMQALPILGFDLLAGLIAQFMVFAGHVAIGLVIFAIGLYLANLAAVTVQSSQIRQSNLVALVARTSIIILAVAMSLRQMGLANEIINSAFVILMGAIGVALALAFGLGGRETAGKALEEFIESRKQQDVSPGQPANTSTRKKKAAGQTTFPAQALDSGVTSSFDGTPVA
jgi:hypothetical protein